MNVSPLLSSITPPLISVYPEHKFPYIIYKNTILIGQQNQEVKKMEGKKSFFFFFDKLPHLMVHILLLFITVFEQKSKERFFQSTAYKDTVPLCLTFCLLQPINCKRLIIGVSHYVVFGCYCFPLLFYVFSIFFFHPSFFIFSFKLIVDK